jgi:hypothetical protein
VNEAPRSFSSSVAHRRKIRIFNTVFEINEWNEMYQCWRECNLQWRWPWTHRKWPMQTSQYVSVPMSAIIFRSTQQ